MTTEAIYDELADDLRGYLRRRVGDAALAEDLLQDVFLRIHEHIDQLDQVERIGAWVYRIARNLVIDHHRRTRPTGELPDLPSAEPDGMDPTQRLSRWLGGAVGRLPDHYREALELTELEGLSGPDAARRLGLSHSGLKSRVQRGRAQLKQMLHRCCAIELDRGGRVVDYRCRDAGCGERGC